LKPRLALVSLETLGRHDMIPASPDLSLISPSALLLLRTKNKRRRKRVKGYRAHKMNSAWKRLKGTHTSKAKWSDGNRFAPEIVGSQSCPIIGNLPHAQSQRFAMGSIPFAEPAPQTGCVQTAGGSFQSSAPPPEGEGAGQAQAVQGPGAQSARSPWLAERAAGLRAENQPNSACC